MKSTVEDILAPYHYTFPPELVATSPAHPRDSAKLLIYNRATGTVAYDTFRNIVQYLPAQAVLVFNQTKVFPARMRLRKETGGAVEALYLSANGERLRVMASGNIAPGDLLQWADGHAFTVEERDGKYALLRPQFPMSQLRTLLLTHGETPLPPYIKHSPLSEAQRRSEYQTVYAKTEGSVAAPTAGLHFTPELLERIQAAGIETAYITLHVNLGTFAPVTEEHIKEKKLHEEFYEIDPQTAEKLNAAKAQNRPIIAVGTTTVRALESAVRLGEGETSRPHTAALKQLRGVTDIFLTEKDCLCFATGLITNFHVPKSSLLMLVSALTGREKLLDVYAQAIEKKFRLFSFGDGMLIV